MALRVAARQGWPGVHAHRSITQHRRLVARALGSGTPSGGGTARWRPSLQAMLTASPSLDPTPAANKASERRRVALLGCARAAEAPSYEEQTGAGVDEDEGGDEAIGGRDEARAGDASSIARRL